MTTASAGPLHGATLAFGLVKENNIPNLRDIAISLGASVVDAAAAASATYLVASSVAGHAYLVRAQGGCADSKAQRAKCRAQLQSS